MNSVFISNKGKKGVRMIELRQLEMWVEDTSLTLPDFIVKAAIRGASKAIKDFPKKEEK